MKIPASTKLTSFLVGGSVALSLVGIDAMASGSDRPSADAEELQEVVVTAEYRKESAQRVPMSITALSAQTLEDRDIKGLADYANTIPNVSYGLGASAFNFGFGGAHEIAIRGISGDDTTGFYLDDTPVPSSIDPHIVGVDRIEVLRGPQGTLYGARSMGGTVRVISNQPDLTDFSATTHAGVSDTEHTPLPNALADATVNLPLVQGAVAVRMEAYYDYEAGYFKRSGVDAVESATLGAPSAMPFLIDNVGRSDERGGSLALLWKVNDSLSITPRILYQTTSYNGFPLADFYYDATGGAPVIRPTSFTQQRLFNIGEYSEDAWTLSSLSIRYHMTAGDLGISTSFFSRNIHDLENDTETIYEGLLRSFGIGPIPVTTLANTRFRRFVQEFRFTSAFEAPVQLVAGLFYSTSYGNFDPGNIAPSVALGANAATGGELGTDLIFEQYVHQRINEPAAYTELSWNLSSALKLIGGMRAYRIETTNNSSQNGFITGSYPAPVVGDPTTITSSGINPKYEVQYQFTPTHMAYALGAKGFRPGGLQVQVPNAPGLGCEADLAQFGLTSTDTRTYKADSLWNYEVGSKNSWADNRIVFNGSLYYIKWQDIQQPVTLPCGYSFLANAGAAKSEGLELELATHPFRGLEVSTGLGYEHAIITQQGSGAGALSPQVPGSPVFLVPDWTFNWETTYSHAVSAGYSMNYHIGYSYVGNRKSGNNNPFEPRVLPAFGIVEGNIGLNWSRYEVMLIGKNLSNTIASYGDETAIGAELPGRPRVAINAPRTVGLEFRATF